MPFLFLPSLAFALLWLLAGAALPWIVLWERRQALTRGRALYDKAASQMGRLAFWVQGSAALAFVLDIAMNGAISRFAGLPLRGVLYALAGSLVAAALFSWLGASSPVRRVWFGLCGVCSLVIAGASITLVWLCLRGMTPEPGLTVSVCEAVSLSLPAGMGIKLPLAFLLFCLCLSVMAGQAAALCWHLLRRGADDLGRDYYLFAVGRRTRLAAYAGALTLAPAAALLLFTPFFSIRRLPELLPLNGQCAFWVLQAVCLALPLAVLCWYYVARSGAPLQKKLVIWLTPALLWLGTWAALARVWL